MWTLLYNSTEQTLAAWGISNLRRRLISQGIDTVAFDLDGPIDRDAAQLFAYGSEVIIKRDGVQWFLGRVDKPRYTASGRVEKISYELVGPWWYLEKIVYQQQWYLAVNPADPDSSISGGYRSHLRLNEGINGSVLSTAQQLTEILTYARDIAGAPLQPDTVYPAITIPIDELRDVTAAECIRKQLRWMPDAVTWFDYATNPPTLHVARRSLLAAHTLDFLDTETCDIAPRQDMQVPAVVLKFEATNTADSATWVTITEQKSPSSATGLEYGALIATIDLQGVTINTVTAIVTTADLDAPTIASPAWWKTKIGWLGNANRITNLAIANASRQLNPAIYPRELTRGQIAPWMNKLAADDTVVADISYQVKNDAGEVMATVLTEKVSVKVKATNASTGTYSALGSLVAGEEIPAGLAASLYAALSELQYEGSITLIQEEAGADQLLGRVINITGGRTEWATARALIQSITESIDDGVTDITVGFAEHLGPSDLVELLRVNRERFVYTAPAARTTGRATGTGEVQLGQDVTIENASTGGRIYQRLRIKGSGENPFTIDLDAITGLAQFLRANRDVKLTESRLQFFDASATATIDLNLVDAAGQVIKLREFEICHNGVPARILLFASPIYYPAP